VAEERARLEDWARGPKTAQALAQRSRIVLGCASGSPNPAVAYQLGLTQQTVGKWRQRCLERRLEGLLDEPRPRAKWATRRLSVDCIRAAYMERCVFCNSACDAGNLMHATVA